MNKIINNAKFSYTPDMDTRIYGQIQKLETKAITDLENNIKKIPNIEYYEKINGKQWYNLHNMADSMFNDSLRNKVFYSQEAIKCDIKKMKIPTWSYSYFYHHIPNFSSGMYEGDSGRHAERCKLFDKNMKIIEKWYIFL